MAYYLFVTYKGSDGKEEMYDVSTLAHDIEFTTSLESQPGKFSFYLERDPNQTLRIAIGSNVQFFSDGECVFLGKVFTIQTDATDVYQVVAYDNLRYLKNEDAIIVDGTDEKMTLVKMFEKIMNAYGFDYYIGKWTKEVTLLPLEEHNFWNESLFDILDYCMSFEEMRQTLPNSTKIKLIGDPRKKDNVLRRFYLKCNCGRIELREIYYDFFHDDSGKDKNTFLLIGDESLISNYEYKVDIDKETYNRFIFVANQEDTSTQLTTTDDSEAIGEGSYKQVEERQMFAAIDSGYRISDTNTNLDGRVIGENTIPKWGVLSKVVEVKSLEPANKLEEYMKTVVQLYSQPSRTLKLNAIGYDGVVAGSAFFLYLSKLDVNYPVYVLSATHRYENNHHTMELEVCTNINMRKFL